MIKVLRATAGFLPPQCHLSKFRECLSFLEYLIRFVEKDSLLIYFTPNATVHLFV